MSMDQRKIPGVNIPEFAESIISVESLAKRVKQLRFVVKGVQEPTNESVPESVKVWNILKFHCIELPGG